MLALEENHLDATRERHVIPLNSEEGPFFLNVILPIAYSKLYSKIGPNKMVPLASMGPRTIGCSIQSFFFLDQ